MIALGERKLSARAISLQTYKKIFIAKTASKNIKNMSFFTFYVDPGFWPVSNPSRVRVSVTYGFWFRRDTRSQKYIVISCSRTLKMTLQNGITRVPSLANSDVSTPRGGDITSDLPDRGVVNNQLELHINICKWWYPGNATFRSLSRSSNMIYL